MSTRRSNPHYTFYRASRLFLVLGLGSMLSILAACADKNDQPVSSDMPMPPVTQGPVTQVIGTITDTEGNPLSGAGIGVTSGTAPVPEILVLSGDNGKYIWKLPPGTFTLTARKDGYKDLSQDVTVKAGETVQLDFKLEKLP
jgi:hypothetical protein